MFDNLAFDYLILRSFKICNFHNIRVYFHFKTVDLSSLKLTISYFGPLKSVIFLKMGV